MSSSLKQYSSERERDGLADVCMRNWRVKLIKADAGNVERLGCHSPVGIVHVPLSWTKTNNRNQPSGSQHIHSPIDPDLLAPKFHPVVSPKNTSNNFTR